MPSCAIVTPAGEHQRPRRRKQSMGLTLEEANRILRGTLAKAQELNIKISAAICDPGGRPIALPRQWQNDVPERTIAAGAVDPGALNQEDAAPSPKSNR